MSESNFSENKVGALWKRKSKDGKKTFLTGAIEVEKLAKLGANDENVNITIFGNSFKKDNPKAPDYVVVYSKPFVPKKKVARKTEDDEDVSFD